VETGRRIIFISSQYTFKPTLLLVNMGNFHRPNHNEEGFNPDAPVRVKMPRGREVIGIIAQRVGAGRMQISCMDGKTRNCRVPGRLRRELWLREGDVVIVEPWEFDQDEKGDILFKYSKAAIEKLKEMGQLKTSDNEF
jgi:translation initiation factor 1A